MPLLMPISYQACAGYVSNWRESYRQLPSLEKPIKRTLHHWLREGVRRQSHLQRRWSSRLAILAPSGRQATEPQKPGREPSPQRERNKKHLVDIDQVHIADTLPSSLQSLLNRDDRSDTHDLWLTCAPCIRCYSSQRLDVVLLDGLFTHDDICSGSIANSRCVSSSDSSRLLDEHGC